MEHTYPEYWSSVPFQGGVAVLGRGVAIIVAIMVVVVAAAAAVAVVIIGHHQMFRRTDGHMAWTPAQRPCFKICKNKMAQFFFVYFQEGTRGSCLLEARRQIYLLPSHQGQVLAETSAFAFISTTAW